MNTQTRIPTPKILTFIPHPQNIDDIKYNLDIITKMIYNTTQEIILGPVLNEDRIDAKVGEEQKCPLANMARRYFGSESCPLVRSNVKTKAPQLRITDPDSIYRYYIELILQAKVNACPKKFDKTEEIEGSIIISGRYTSRVTRKPTKERTNTRKGTIRRPKPPRDWSYKTKEELAIEGLITSF